MQRREKAGLPNSAMLSLTPNSKIEQYESDTNYIHVSFLLKNNFPFALKYPVNPLDTNILLPSTIFVFSDSIGGPINWEYHELREFKKIKPNQETQTKFFFRKKHLGCKRLVVKLLISPDISHDIHLNSMNSTDTIKANTSLEILYYFNVKNYQLNETEMFYY
jgi:hypothetical protein